MIAQGHNSQDEGKKRQSGAHHVDTIVPAMCVLGGVQGEQGKTTGEK